MVGHRAEGHKFITVAVRRVDQAALECCTAPNLEEPSSEGREGHGLPPSFPIANAMQTFPSFPPGGLVCSSAPLTSHLVACWLLNLQAAAKALGCSPYGFLGLSLNDWTIPFLVFLLDKTFSVG